MPKLSEEAILEDILYDIEDEKCILLVGPEIIQIEGKPIAKYVHEKILENHSGFIEYYYSNVSLFLFRDKNSKNRAAGRLKYIYPKKEEIKDGLLEKILQLPLPLIISLNPDTLLSDFAEKAGIAHQFSHFCFNGKANGQIEAPTAQNPLIYNIFGSIREEESLLLDYDDLFQFLGSIIPAGLPQKIRNKLKDARSFIFLGFDFNKWYSQLLIQLLAEKESSKFALNTDISDPQAKNFLIHQFKIQFLDKELGLFDRLFDRLEKEGMLRKLAEQVNGKGEAISKEAIEEVKKLVVNGELGKAFNRLEGLALHTSFHTEALLLSSRFNTWKRDNEAGIQTQSDANIELNKIRQSLFGLLEKINRP
ncbi:MAG: SIR2 family protein [Lewinellaceae bacterium]|nr:SIR2 family protein [Lewinellaceae bacterium]MCB9288014.1 SIR2 family protein [Lewinellaceae bacterium]